MIEVGLSNKLESAVTENDTARVFGSGELDVLATPRMVALMEECAYKALSPYLEEGTGTVGTYLSVEHLSATPVGMKIFFEATVESVDGRKIEFYVQAHDECGLIGQGKHVRFIVYNEKFMERTNSKLQSK